MQLMKMYLLTYIIKSQTLEATLTHSLHELISVSKYVCQKSEVLFSVKICELD